MSTRRLGVGVAVLAGYLYAVGGSDGTSPLNTGLDIFIFFTLRNDRNSDILWTKEEKQWHMSEIDYGHILWSGKNQCPNANVKQSETFVLEVSRKITHIW